MLIPVSITYLLKFDIASNLRDWFAVKMTKAEKNLVIVFDIGQNTGTTVPGSGETYHELIVQSVKETVQTLTPNDKVTRHYIHLHLMTR